MEFLIFLGSVLTIILAFAIAKEFERIAEMKGYEEKRYFWWSFLLTVAGWAMVIALPDRKKIEIPVKKEEFIKKDESDKKDNSFFHDDIPDI